MAWSDHVIWWHVYPLGFLGAEHAACPAGAPPAARLPRLANWLGYLVELGCNGLALGPVFASETHGYDTVDHFRVDPRLGSEADLRRLVDEASARGVRVLLDGVFNHVGRSFPAFADADRRGAASPYSSWFHREPGTAGGYQVFEGHHQLVTLNHDNPEVADYVTEVMTYWLDRGVDGWRLDAAYAVPRSFWRTVTNRVRARHPGAWIVGEVIHGDYSGYVTDGGLDSVTQYELWKAIWSSLNDRNFFELAWALDRHNQMLGTFAPLTFLGNHDVTRLASRLHDDRHLEHALVILLTTGGIPSIYAGDERAFRGVKEEREGGDDAIRPTFPAGPSALGAVAPQYYRLHQLLVGLRRRHPWLARARTSVSSLANAAISYTLADHAGGSRLGVALNLAERPVTLALPPGDWQCVAGSGEFTAEQARLPPAGWAIAAGHAQHTS